MSMNYKVGGSGQEYEKLPPGTHIAVCNLVCDVGLQPGNPKFAGVIDKDGKPDSRGMPSQKLFMRFEVPSERMTYTKDGVEKEGPMTIYANFRASVHPKASLRQALEGWRGKKFTDKEAELFDVASVLGKACQILVMHSDDGKYANVNGIMPLPKGVTAPKTENPLILYSNEQDAQYNDLPKFLRDKIDNQLNPPVPKQTGPDPHGTMLNAEADRIARQQATKKADAEFVDDAELPF